MATGEAREALGQLIRREKISASSHSLDEYKSAVEAEYQLMAEDYDEQMREARQGRVDEQRGAD
jgi:hypothetical protein